MSTGSIFHEETSQKSLHTGREERLEEALEYEIAAHRELCKHYVDALEQISALESELNAKNMTIESISMADEEENVRKKDKIFTKYPSQRIFATITIFTLTVAVFTCIEFI